MRILWHSNAPWATTGYGVQTSRVVPKIKEAGHEIAISAYYGLEGNIVPWEDIAVFPGLPGTFGNEVILAHATAYFGGNIRSGLVTTLMDVWVLDPQVAAQANMACWVPVDHDPVTPKVEQFFENSAAIPIAMSRFGQERLERFDPLYVPHVVDTSVYRPHDKAKARELVGLGEDAFVVGMVAANQGVPSRKCFPQAIEAFARFHSEHPEAVLMLHTDRHCDAGVDIDQLISHYELLGAVHTPPEYRYRFMPPSPEEMSLVYSMFDVLLNPSMGEGFGVPILEAQACGVPAIVTDFSAMQEVCGAGWKVDYKPIYTGQNSYMADPFVEDILEALQAAHAAPKAQRESMARQARQHALQYDTETVMREHMLPALEECAERFGLVQKQLEVAA